MVKIVTVEQMRAIEKAADAAGHSYADMMTMAGQAVAERILLKISTDVDKDAPRVVVLVGPGNNGGDGLVAAKYVKESYPDAEVSAYLLKARKDELLKDAQESGVVTETAEDDKNFRTLKNLATTADILVDALFGTGTRVPIEGEAADVMKALAAAIKNRQQHHPRSRSITPTQPAHDISTELSLDHFREEIPAASPDHPYVIAVDCPTGLNCDTGEIDPLMMPADETVTFGAAKPGLLTFPGADATGLLHVADIGIPADNKALNAIQLELATAPLVGSLLPDRPRNSHKGTFGKAFIVAGSINFIGAAYLATAAAYRVGAGLVTGAVPQMILPSLATMLPEATWVLLPNNMGMINKSASKVVREELDGYTALLVGPGIGNEDDTREFIEDLLQPKVATKKTPSRLGFGSLINEIRGDDDAKAGDTPLPPLVIDADGLNVLAQIEEWWKLLPKDTIITPHPAEFARLAGISDAAEVQANRIKIAQEKAAVWNCVVVLKGAFTVIAAPDGRATVSPFASPSLATAGTGDVLAGAITGLLAQKLAAYEAAVAGVWLHGWAGTHEQPNRGNIASDVVDALAMALQVAEYAG